MELEQRVQKLEKEVRLLKDELAALKNQLRETEATDSQRNVVDDYMVKIVYTGIYQKVLDSETQKIGFPKNRRTIAAQISVGQKMFVYVTSPVKKIIGLMTVVNEVEETPGRWPYSITLKWDIGPKPGVSFSDVGLDIRPRIGDTLYSITSEKAKVIFDLLNAQEDLSRETIRYLANEYRD